MKSFFDNMYDSFNPPKWVVRAGLGIVCAGSVGYMLYKFTGRKSTPSHKSDSEAPSSPLDVSMASDEFTKVDERSVTDGDLLKGMDELDLEVSVIDRANKLKNSGNSMYQSKQFQNALKLYGQALSLLSDESGDEPVKLKAMLYQNRAAVLDTLGEYDKALLDLNLANDLDKKYIKARKRRAKICENLGMLKQAVEDYIVAAIAEDFQDNGTLVNADRLLDKYGQAEAIKNASRRTKFFPAKRVFRTCYNSFRFDPVITSLKDFQPSSELSGLDAIKAALLEEDYANVGTLCKQFIEENPSPSSTNLDEWLQVLLVLGTYHLCCVELVEALNAFEQIITAPTFGPPSRTETLCRVAGLSRRGNVWLQTQQFAKLELDFQQALEMDDQNADVYHLHGQYCLMMQNLEGALKDFKKAYSLTGKTNDVIGGHVYFTLFKLGIQTMSNDKIMSAQNSLLAICQRCEKLCEPDSLLALTYMETQRYDLAEQHFKIANEKDPSDGTVLVHRALAELQANGNLTNAVTYLEQAIAVDPHLELAYETLATVEIQRGNLEKAIELFEKAEVLTNGDVEMAHVIALKAAAEIQLKLSKELDIQNLNQFAFFRQAQAMSNHRFG